MSASKHNLWTTIFASNYEPDLNLEEKKRVIRIMSYRASDLKYILQFYIN